MGHDNKNVNFVALIGLQNRFRHLRASDGGKQAANQYQEYC
jgi:hypothetical protein